MCVVGVKFPRVLSRPAATQYPREFDNTHTTVFDPDYNMMPSFFPQQPIFCSLQENQNLNREQPQSPLPCLHVISVASIGVASTPVAKMHVLVFAGDWACEIELRQTGVIRFPWRRRSWSCGVFKSWIWDAHCPFQWKWQVLHNYDISVLHQVGLFFDGIACLMKVWPLFKREFPRVPTTWRSARARANFKYDIADVNK